MTHLVQRISGSIDWKTQIGSRSFWIHWMRPVLLLNAWTKKDRRAWYTVAKEWTQRSLWRHSFKSFWIQIVARCEGMLCSFRFEKKCNWNFILCLANSIQALIEREWIQAGFPFATRHKYSCYTSPQMRQKTSASTFVLFLDSVYQLHCQFPFSFEFNTQMLILLYEHSFFSSYGTFLGDSERERQAIKLHSRTTSLWSYLNRPDVLKSLLNPMYEPNQGVIWPSVAPISLELWTGNDDLNRKHQQQILNDLHLLFFFQNYTWDGWSIKHKPKICFIKFKH